MDRVFGLWEVYLVLGLGQALSMKQDLGLREALGLLVIWAMVDAITAVVEGKQLESGENGGLVGGDCFGWPDLAMEI